MGEKERVVVMVVQTLNANNLTFAFKKAHDIHQSSELKMLKSGHKARFRYSGLCKNLECRR